MDYNIIVDADLEGTYSVLEAMESIKSSPEIISNLVNKLGINRLTLCRKIF